MIENALDFEGLKYNNEKVKSYIKDEIEKETTRAIEVENNKVDKTTVATNSSLGLVKSGEDITVDADGNVSVNDNSHNHTLSNLSDLLTTKDELNVLSGITVNTMEINHLKDSTSNIQEQLNNKAPLDSPVLTGMPQAPTAETGNNTTQIATTEFVQNEISNLDISGKKIYSTLENPINATSYTIPFHKNASSESKAIYNNDGLWYKTLDGTTSARGYAELVLGNDRQADISENTHTDGNKYGRIKLYGINKYYNWAKFYSLIYPFGLTDNRTITLPDASGTIALTTSNVASADLATKATQDGNGNVITSTYAPKVDAVFSINDVAFEVNDKYNGTGNSYYGNSDYFRISVVDRVFAYKMGVYCRATASGAIAHGNYTTASGMYSRSGGYYTTASGVYSTAEGEQTVASGYGSYANGYGTYALGRQFAIGKYNNTTVATGSTYGYSYDTAFVIGNGSGAASEYRSNAFRVTFGGTTYATGEYITSGADYAEFFEWLDGNIDNEDRRGYFVTLDGDKIRIANPDDYIIGIISGQPSVVGNGDEDWMGRYILDEFGSYIYEEFEYKEGTIDEETKEIISITKTGTRRKQNPDYDSSKPYTQRKDRPEWDCVGMMGVLSVRDDGTCKVNGYCKVTDGGIATVSDSGYRVIKRVTDNIVKVVFK